MAYISNYLAKWTLIYRFFSSRAYDTVYDDFDHDDRFLLNRFKICFDHIDNDAHIKLLSNNVITIFRHTFKIKST